MASFRPETHKTLVSLLIEQRKAKKLSLRKVVSRLPEWMNFQFSTLGKIERGVRDVSYAELREIARVLGTSVAALDVRVDEIEAAKAKAARGTRKKKA
jgi:transcriptional regulator with XRE-family HTH domain